MGFSLGDLSPSKVFEDLTGNKFGKTRDAMQQGFHGGSFSEGGKAAISAFDPLISKERFGNTLNKSVGGGKLFSDSTMNDQASAANFAGKAVASYYGGKWLTGLAGAGGGSSAAGTAAPGTEAAVGTSTADASLASTGGGAGGSAAGAVDINPYTDAPMQTSANAGGATASQPLTQPMNQTGVDPATPGTSPYGQPAAAPSATPTAAAPATTSGWQTAAKWAPAAVSAINALTAKPKQPSDQQNQQSDIANTQQTTGQNLLNQYNSGQLSAADSFNVAQWEQQQTQATKEYYGKAGLADSSMAQQAIAGIKSQASSMRSQVLQNYLNSGMQALGSAATTLGPIVNQQIAADERAQKAQQDFFNSLAQMTVAAST